jgi:hypothetical protein
VNPFQPKPGATASLSATATSATATLPDGEHMRLHNQGSFSVFVRLGATGTTAVTSDMELVPGMIEVVAVAPSQTHIAGVCASGESTTLHVQGGEGL